MLIIIMITNPNVYKGYLSGYLCILMYTRLLMYTKVTLRRESYLVLHQISDEGRTNNNAFTTDGWE